MGRGVVSARGRVANGLWTIRPAIDRGPSIPGPGRTKRSSGSCHLFTRARTALLLGIVSAALLTSGLLTVRFAAPGDHQTDQNLQGSLPRIMTYVPHNPIHINGNMEFYYTARDEGWPGDGSQSNPYVIAGYEIDASGDTTGISIQSVDVHFIIDGCNVYGAQGYGIYLDNVWIFTQWVRISNNSCSLNSGGICVSSGSYVLIRDNSCSGNAANGIVVLGSSPLDDAIVNNTCTSNGDAGIYLYGEWITIRENTCTGNQIGLDLYYSYSVTAIANNCSDNQYGIRLHSSSWNDIDENNCSSCQYGTRLEVYSNDNTLAANTMSWNILDGINVDGSASNMILANNCSDNGGTGAYVNNSSYNTIRANDIWDNTGFGVHMHWSEYNEVWNNTFQDNNGAGSVFDPDHTQAYDDGLSNSWNSTGQGNYWSDWQAPDSNHDGIVDIPYDVSGVADSRDFFPLTTPSADPIPLFSPGMIAVVGFVATMIPILIANTRQGRLQKPSA